MTSNEILKSPRADDIFRIGLETLVDKAPSVVTGLVSNYTKQVDVTSSPPESIPMRWSVSAQIIRPQVLKGQVPAGSIQFSRSEQSMIMPPDGTALYWESTYGDIDPNGHVVLFFGNDGPQQIIKAVPSGQGEQDLIELVKNIVQIQAIKKPEDRIIHWLSYLDTSPTSEGCKVALRSVMRASIEWPKLEPVLNRFLKNPRYGLDVRGFAFGIAAFTVSDDHWSDERDTAVDFLCRTFAVETDPVLVLQYLDSLGVILDYCDDEDFEEERRPVREQIIQTLKARKSLAIGGGPAVEPEMEQEYQEILKEFLQQ